MNNFTKEYIELCKNERIQKLHPVWEIGDRVIWNNNIREITVVDELFNPTPKDLELYRWLPTGDQLDEEIVKICRKRDYAYEIWFIEDKWDVALYENQYGKEAVGEIFNKPFIDFNPLITKIKLLIQLLESEKWVNL